MTKRVVTPMILDYSKYYEKNPVVFCVINFDAEGCLSITGVVGPRPDGDCQGGCGQIDLVKLLEMVASFCDGWSYDLVLKFAEIWERWHLNDMRPECSHQRALGWRKLARKEITLYHYSLKSELYREKLAIKKDIVLRATAGETVKLDDAQLAISALQLSLTSHKPELDPAIAEFYEPKKSLYSGDKGFTETKTLGWLTPEEHPDGILTKPCPECGYKYGTQWLHERVPDLVIKFLNALPAPQCTLPAKWRD